MQITIGDGGKTANTDVNGNCTDNNNIAALEMAELKHEVAQIASSQVKKKNKKRSGKSGNDKKKTEEEQEAKCRKLYKSMSKPEGRTEMYTTWKPLHDLYLKNPYDYKGFRSEYAELVASEKVLVKPEIRCRLSLSQPRLFVRIVVNGVPTIAFIDTGAYISFMSETFAKRSGVYEKIDTRERKITNGIGGSQKSIGTINLCSFKSAETNFEWRFDVMKKFKYDVLIGIDFMRHLGCFIDIPRKRLLFNEDKQVEFLSIAEITNESRNESCEYANYMEMVQTVHSPGSPLFSSDSRGHYNLLIQNLDKIISEAKENVPQSFLRTVSPFIEIDVNGVPGIALVDTGFQSTNINIAFAMKSGLLPKIHTKHTESVIGFEVVETIGTIFSCPFDIGDTQYEAKSSVMKEEHDWSEDVLIGADFMQRHKCSIDLARNRLIFDGNAHVEFLSASELRERRVWC